MLLLIAANKNVRRWCVLQWHIIHPEFRDHGSPESNLELGDTSLAAQARLYTHTYTRAPGEVHAKKKQHGHSITYFLPS